MLRPRDYAGYASISNNNLSSIKMLNYLLLLVLFGVSVCEKRPNFVVVLTDDQDVVLGGMTPMKNVKRFVADLGVTFPNSYVTSPICCPSRASLLTGLYIHNHHTVNNSIEGGCYSQNWRNSIQNFTFNNIMHKNGYNTFYAGKYLNEYGVERAGGPDIFPPGWSEWHGLVGNSVYYNYTISNNGVPTYSSDYLTDVIRDLSVSFIENQTDSVPFLMVVSPPAPHQPFTPATRHEGKFSNVTVSQLPNFNVTAQDKHWLLRMSPTPLPPTVLPQLDHVYRSRWETLLAVDEMLADIIDTLETSAMLDNTYVLYTSDNGYHIGQFSQMYDKRQPYESDIRVPLVIKGPGIEPNTTDTQPVLNIDLAPTILKLAGFPVQPQIDGRAIEFGQHKEERFMLVEYSGEGRSGSVDATCPWKYDGNNLAECYPEYECKCQDSRNNTYGCIRHIAPRINKKYCQFYDQEKFVEIYDLSDDPYELYNAFNTTMPAIRHWYDIKLKLMSVCSGAATCDVI